MVPRSEKPTIDDLRRLIGYLMATFISIFIYFPFLWVVNLMGLRQDLYTRWLICSAFIVVFNFAFYFWRYPPKLVWNLIIVAGVDILVMIWEFFWIMG